MATRNNIVFMAVTSDEFELPLAVADTATEIGRIFGKSLNAVCSSISRGHNGRYNDVKFVRVELDVE